MTADAVSRPWTRASNLLSKNSTDSLVGDAPKTQGCLGNYAAKMGRFGTIAIAIACLGYSEMGNGAPTLNWGVTSISPEPSDINEDLPGLEREFIYTIINESLPIDNI